MTQLREKDVSLRISQSGADCIICTADLAEVLDKVTRELPRRILVSEGSQRKDRSVSFFSHANTTYENYCIRDNFLNFIKCIKMIHPNDDNVCYREGWENYEDLINNNEKVNDVECVNSKGSDVAQLFFTSGTTGRPKMVPHTHGSYGIGHIATARYVSQCRF